MSTIDMSPIDPNTMAVTLSFTLTLETGGRITRTTIEVDVTPGTTDTPSVRNQLVGALDALIDTLRIPSPSV